VGKTVVVALLACLPESLLTAGAWIVSYLLAEMYLALLNVVFVRTLPDERPISITKLSHHIVALARVDDLIQCRRTADRRHSDEFP
jgi:hypothetical protein